MPRIRDTLQRDVDVLLIGEALLRTGAWLALPAVLGGLAAGGVGLGVNARLGLVSPGAALALAAAGLGATALVALGGLGLWLTADVVEGFTPVWLASAASEVAQPLQRWWARWSPAVPHREEEQTVAVELQQPALPEV